MKMFARNVKHSNFFKQDSRLDNCSFFFFFCIPKLYLWGSPFSFRFLHMSPFFNPTIQVVTFHLRGQTQLITHVHITHMDKKCTHWLLTRTNFSDHKINTSKQNEKRTKACSKRRARTKEVKVKPNDKKR